MKRIYLTTISKMRILTTEFIFKNENWSKCELKGLHRIWNFLLTFRHYCTNEEIQLQPLETHLNRKIYSDGIFTRQREGKVFFPSIVATEFGKYLSSTVSSPIPREKYYLIFSPVGMISLSRLEEKKPGSLYRFRQTDTRGSGPVRAGERSDSGRSIDLSLDAEGGEQKRETRAIDNSSRSSIKLR